MTNSLYHYGIKGQKWGIRRFQNSDGSLTEAGRRRYGYGSGESSEDSKRDEEKTEKNSKSKDTAKKSVSDYSNDELQEAINRLRKEKEYLDLKQNVSKLQPKHTSLGKRFVQSALKDVVVPALKDSSKKILTEYLNKKGTKTLKLDEQKKDPLADLKLKEQKLSLERKITEQEDYFEKRKERRRQNGS